MDECQTDVKKDCGKTHGAGCDACVQKHKKKINSNLFFSSPCKTPDLDTFCAENNSKKGSECVGQIIAACGKHWNCGCVQKQKKESWDVGGGTRRTLIHLCTPTELSLLGCTSKKVTPAPTKTPTHKPTGKPTGPVPTPKMHWFTSAPTPPTQPPTPAPTSSYCPTVRVVGLEPGDKNFDLMGVYALGYSDILTEHKDNAAKAVYLKMPAVVTVQKFRSGGSKSMLKAAKKAMYYNEVYHEWVMADSIGSMPFGIVSEEQPYAPYAVSTWKRLNMDTYEFDPLFRVHVFCVRLAGGKQGAETIYYPPGIKAPPTPHTNIITPHPTPAPSPKPTPAVYRGSCVCRAYPRADPTKKRFALQATDSWGSTCSNWGKAPKAWCYVEKHCKEKKGVATTGTFHIDGAYLTKFLATKSPWHYCDPCECTGEFSKTDKSRKGSFCDTHGQKQEWCYVQESCTNAKPSHIIPGSSWAFCTKSEVAAIDKIPLD